MKAALERRGSSTPESLDAGRTRTATGVREEIKEDLLHPKKAERKRMEREKAKEKATETHTLQFLGETQNVSLEDQKAVLQALARFERAIIRKGEITPKDKDRFTTIAELIGGRYSEGTVFDKLVELNTLIDKKVEEAEKSDASVVKEKEASKDESVKEGEARLDKASETDEKAATMKRAIQYFVDIQDNGLYKKEMKWLDGLIERGETKDGLTTADLIAVREAVIADAKARVAKMDAKAPAGAKETTVVDKKTPEKPDSSGREKEGKDRKEKINLKTRTDEDAPYRFFGDSPTPSVEFKVTDGELKESDLSLGSLIRREERNKREIPSFSEVDISTFGPFDEVKFRESMPEHVQSLVREVAQGDHAEEAKIVKLWDVAEGKGTSGSQEKDARIRKTFQMITELADADDLAKAVAISTLEQLLQVEKKETSQESPASLEVDAIKRFFKQIGVMEGYKEVAQEVEDLFSMLEISPDEHPAQKDLLVLAQQDLRDNVLLKRLPAVLGLASVGNFETLNKAIHETPLSALLAKMPALKTFLADDQALTALKQVYATVTGKTKPVKRAPALAFPPTPEKKPDAAPSSPPEVTQVAPEDPRKARLREVARQLQSTGRSPEKKSENQKAAFLNYLGVDEDDQDASDRAIRGVLIDHPETDFDQLQVFMKTGALEKGDLAEWKAKKGEIETEIAGIEGELESIRAEQRKGTGDATEQRQRTTDLARRKAQLNQEKDELRDKIQKASGKVAETRRYKSKEQMLVMLNYYYETLEAKKNGETPDYSRAAEKAKNSLNRARREIFNEGHGKLSKAISIFRPRLRSTLEQIGIQDDRLKTIDQKKWKQLAEKNDQNGVEAWVDSLAGSPEAKMEQTALIIGHLNIALNAGRMTRLNTRDLERGLNLVEHLEAALNKQQQLVAEKVQGEDIDRMDAYLKLFIQGKEKAAKVSESDLGRFSTKRTIANTLKVLGMGAGTITGVAAISALGSALVVGGAGLGLAGVFTKKYMEAKDDKTRKLYQSGAMRSTMATALATGTTAALGLSAWPVLGATAVGSIFPELWNGGKKLYKLIRK